MKPEKLITVFIIVAISVVGCKDDTQQSTPETVSEKLVLNVLNLQYRAEELSMQVAWLRAHLEKCLRELEKQHGLKAEKFDWTSAMGFPKLKQDPNKPRWYTSKPRPFYVPYRGIKKPEIEIERYTDIEELSVTVGLTNSTLANNMLGMDKYIKHLEERLKRIENHLEEVNGSKS